MKAHPLPRPPLALTYPNKYGSCEPARDVARWAEAVLIDPGAPFWREEYQLLPLARIGWLWTNIPRNKGNRATLGRCELVNASGDAWTKGRERQQLEEWFGEWWRAGDVGELPDFLITLYAPGALECNAVGFAALVAHELRHVGQRRGFYGDPQWAPDGRPQWTVQAHDVEEFVSVVEDFGADDSVRAIAAAAGRLPRFQGAYVDGVCGTCRRHLHAV